MAIISGGNLVLSESTPIWGNSSWYGGTGFEMTHRFATYAAIYRNHQMVASVVDRIAECIARLPLKVYQRADDGRIDARDTPYAKLLRKPNPRHDPYFFWQWTVSTFLVHGEAMWLKIRDPDDNLRLRVKELWPLNPVNITVDRDNNDKLWYRYMPGGGPNRDQPKWPVEDVVHFKRFNPDGTVRGLSFLEPLRAVVTNSDAARRAQTAVWNNGSRPELVLTHPKVMSEAAQTRLTASWASKHQGVDNWSKPAILEEGMGVEKLTLSAEESQYIQTMKEDNRSICALYNISPIAMHDLEHATYSNVTMLLRALYRDTIAPRCSFFESVMNHQLRPDFDVTNDDYYAEFLMDEVLRGDFEERIAAQATGVNAGLLMPAEGRQMENRPFVEGSDQLLVNGNMIPLDAVREQNAPPEQLQLPVASEEEQAIARMERDLARTNGARR